MARFLVVNGAPMHSSVVMECIQTNQLDTLELLLELGANPDSTTDRGVKVLTMATKHKMTPVIRILVKAGASIDLRTIENGKDYNLKQSIAWYNEHSPGIMELLKKADRNNKEHLKKEKKIDQVLKIKFRKYFKRKCAFYYERGSKSITFIYKKNGTYSGDISYSADGNRFQERGKWKLRNETLILEGKSYRLNSDDAKNTNYKITNLSITNSGKITGISIYGEKAIFNCD